MNFYHYRNTYRILLVNAPRIQFHQLSDKALLTFFLLAVT